MDTEDNQMAIGSVGAWVAVFLVLIFIVIPIPFILKGRKKTKESNEPN